MSNKDVKQDALDNLADALTEDILNTPDDELLREVEEDYGDPRALANKFDQILERAEKQAFGAAPPTTALEKTIAFVLYYRERMRDKLSTLFGNRMVLAGAAAVLIALILGPAIFLISEFNERSGQLAALEKEQLARSEQLAAQERELIARSEQLAAREKEGRGDAPALGSAAAVPLLCKDEPFEQLVCADADLTFWQNLVTEIYQHRWQQLDANGQQMLRQGQLDWLRKLRVDCNVPETGTWNAAEMARAKSCVLQSTKERVAVLSNN